GSTPLRSIPMVAGNSTSSAIRRARPAKSSPLIMGRRYGYHGASEKPAALPRVRSPARSSVGRSSAMPDTLRPNAVEQVPIDALVLAEPPRALAEDDDHVRALAETDTALPPILVHRPTMQVVDGRHRLRAAQLRGRDHIGARFVDDDEADLFVLAGQENVSHGRAL